MSFLGFPLETGLSALFENKPSVPQFHWTDLVQQQLDTTSGNLQVLPQAEKLGAGVNEFMRGERAKTLASIPGMPDIEGGVTANLKDWLRGNLSPDLVSQISRGANARAFAGGYGGAGTGMKSNLEARDLGLGALQLQQSAMPMANQYLGQEYAMRATPEFNPASMFINPMQAGEFNARQNAAQFQRDWLANRVAAQPDPWQSTLMSGVGALGSAADMAGGSYLGGYFGGKGLMAGMGGGGGGGMPGPGQLNSMLNEYYGGMSMPSYGSPTQFYDYTPPAMGSAMYG